MRELPVIGDYWPEERAMQRWSLGEYDSDLVIVYFCESVVLM